MSRRKELADSYYQLKQMKKHFEDKKKAIQAQLDEVERELVTEMEDEELENFKSNGRLFYMRPEVYVSIDNSDELFKYLRDTGHGECIKETVHNSTLKAIVKEELEKSGAEVPGVKTHFTTKIGLRNSQKKEA